MESGFAGFVVKSAAARGDVAMSPDAFGLLVRRLEVPGFEQWLRAGGRAAQPVEIHGLFGEIDLHTHEPMLPVRVDFIEPPMTTRRPVSSVRRRKMTVSQRGALGWKTKSSGKGRRNAWAVAMSAALLFSHAAT